MVRGTCAAVSLQALRWEDVEFLDGVIHVRRGWTPWKGEIAPKSRTGIRRVPMPSILRECLEALYARRLAMGFVFRTRMGVPFDPRRVA